CVFGIVLVAAASPAVAERNDDPANYFIIRHIIYLAPALVSLIGISMMNIQQVWRTALIVLGTTLFCLFLVTIVGVEVKGAQRWLQLGPISLQPSEFIKPSFIVVAAWFIARQKEKPEFKGIHFAVALYFIVISFLLLQPDMG